MVSLYYFFKMTLVLVASVLLAIPAEAKGLGACVKQPDPQAPTEGDLYSVRIGNGQSIALDHGEDARKPGSYFYKAIRGCRPRDYVSVYDSEGNAHLTFVIKDRKRAVLPMRGANRNKCDIARRILEYTDGAYAPECVWGDASVLAKEWAKAKKEEAAAEEAEIAAIAAAE